MPKLLKDILDGVKKSKIVPGSTGTNPGVDYEPKAPNEQEFVKKHEREEHADRVGNEDDIYQATNIKPALANPKETKHGRKDIKASEKVNEAANTTNKTLKEVLTKKTSAGEFIKDFQDSDNPKFAGKSKEKRKQMALGAYYAKQNEEVKLDEASAESLITNFKDRQAYLGHKKQEADHMTRANKSKDTTKQHHLRMADQHNVNANDILDRYKKTNEDLAVPLLGGKDNDESAEMAKTQLRALANKALHLAMQLGDEQMIEPWIQAKIAVAKDHVSAVHDYMVYGDHSKDKEEDEQTAPYDGGIDMSGAPRNTYPDFSVDVGRNV